MPVSVPALSEELTRLLDDVGSKLAAGRDVGETFEPVPRLLGSLPVTAIARVATEIANAARLWRWAPPEKGLGTLFRVKLTQREQLDRHDALKYLFIFHNDGYLREAALNKMTGSLDAPFFVVAIAWRLNDWVEPVRRAAARCGARTFPETSDDVIARAGLGLHLQRFSLGRWGGEREILEQALGRPGVSESLAALLATGPTGPLSRIFREALRRDGLDPHLEAIARTAVQPAVRALAARTVLSGIATWVDGYEWKWIDKAFGVRHRVPRQAARQIVRTISPDDMMAAAAVDPFVAVRKVAIDQLIREPLLFADRRKIAAGLARDANASIRERAAFALEHS